MGSPFALRIGRVWSTTVRPFGPLEAQPAEVFEHSVDEVCSAPLRIKVLVSHDEHAGILVGTTGRDRKRTGMPNVQQARRRWC